MPSDVLDYLAHFDDDVASCVPVRIAAPGQGWKVTRKRLLKKHVVMWRLVRSGRELTDSSRATAEWGV